jgi:uncharacterized protein YkwD
MNLRNCFCCALLSILAMPSAFAQMVEEQESESVTSNAPPAEAVKVERSPAAAELIVQQTNEFRQSENLEAVQVNAKLAETAQYFAQYMAKTDAYGHTADGNRPAGRATRFGYEYCLVSENIAYQYSSLGFETEELASRFVTGWKESPEHRKNMLEPAAIETGVAVAQSPSTGYWYAVQMFGRPKSQAIEFTITNRSTVDVSYTIDERTFLLPPRYSRTHTRCRKSEVDVEAQREAALDTTVTPASGERFVIEGQGGELRIQKE